MVEREEHSNDEWRYLGAPLGLRHPIPISPQEPPGNFDSGGQVDGLSDGYGCNILCGKHQGGTENISIHHGHGSFRRSTKSFFLTTSRLL